MQFPYVMTGQSLTVIIGNKTYTVDRSNRNWEKIKEEIRKEIANGDKLIELMTPETAVKNFTAEIKEITVRHGQIFYGEDKVHENLASRIIDIMEQGFPVEPWHNFVQNCFANPSPIARQELYDFLEKSDLPITPDGCFLAYKIVTEDYKDIRTRTFDNRVGKTVEMPRENVDPIRHNVCSTGLHFCSKGYLNHYGSGGSRVVIVKINPADVVSIPTDYNFAKGRTWKYEVVDEVDRETAGYIRWQAVHSHVFDMWDDDDGDEDPSYWS